MYKLLIVDDEEIERRAIEHIVSKGSMKIGEIDQAENGQEAVSVASVFEPDIIIMDISMPGLNGIKAASVIKKFLPDARIIFLTAFDEFDYAKQAVKLGADDFVVKPASPETLELAIINSIKNIELNIEQKKKTSTANEKLQGATSYLKECLVEALIYGESDEGKISKYLSFTNLDFDYSYGGIVNLNWDNSITEIAMNHSIKRQRIFSKIKTQLANILKNHIFYTDENRLYVFVYHSDYDSIANSQPLFDEAIKSESEKTYAEHKVKLDIGIGPICDSINKVWNSFGEAKQKIRSKLDRSTDSLKTGVLDKLVSGIIDNDLHLVNEEIICLHNALQDEINAIEDYRIKLMELSIELKQAIIQKANRPIAVSDSLYVLASKVKSTDEGREYLLHYAKSLCKICAIDEKDKNAIIVNKMTTYIEEHLSENITLEHLSDISKLSSYYICKLFKKYLEMSFSEYVAYLRIRKAKELLKNPLMSIKEIGFNLGYADPNYFTRVFKKEMGVSPTQYRKQHIY